MGNRHFGSSMELSGQIHVVCEVLRCFLDVPSLASASASSFPMMFACALTLYNVVG